MDHNGAVQTVVIGVGEFLGFGKKDVAVPFSAMQWRTEARNAPAADHRRPAPFRRSREQAANPRRRR